ncbi:S8 family serine peptidase [Streptomyces sp. NPDC003023]|uniref:S8 family serine peptidase n=1 Tax=Streptomyces sp. NPDC003023 TaxID=3364675 RepID=UPI0036AD8EF0
MAAATIATGALMALSATTAGAQPPENRPGFSRVVLSDAPVPAGYVVVLKDQQLSHHAARVHVAELTQMHGGSVRHVYSSALRGYAARMSPAEAERVAADPRVARVEQDSVIRESGSQPNPPSWGLDRVDQRSLPLNSSYSYPGTAGNVTAYVLDGGIRTSHSQFGGRASVGFDAVGDGYNGQDCKGHGTHVAGTLGGKDYGIAKEVKLVSVRVLDCNGTGSKSQILAGVDWITAHAVKPAVVNMSINGPASSTEDAAIRNSIAGGITYVASSGNDGTDACKNSPGRISEVLVVNNATSRDARSSSSNYGRCTDLFAPGASIKSAWKTSDTATNTISGTSMASPHVAGAAALYLSAHPAAAPAEVHAALTGAATPDVIADAGSGSPNRNLFIDGNSPPPSGGSVVFSDDFESDRGWQIDAAGTDTATTGVWEVGDPEQTLSTYSDQVKQLGTTVSGIRALSTGAAAGSGYGANDLDGGRTTAFSPLVALPSSGALSLKVSYNVAHGDNSGPDDYLRVRVLDGTTPTTVFEKTGAASEVAGAWRTATVDLSAFAGKTVRVYVEAVDAGTASLFEAQIDDLTITTN